MHLLARAFGVRLHYVRVGANRKHPTEEVCPETPPGYFTRVVQLVDLLPYVDEVPDLSRDHLEAVFARGDECVANFYGGDLVGFSFNSRKRTRVTDQVDALIPEGFRYGYKSWTHPDHRRRNLGRMRGFVKRRDLARPFQERNVSYVETHNYPSLLHGYRHPRERQLAMGFVGWITVFGRQIPFTSPRAKWLGFEFVGRNDVRIRQYA